MLSKMNNNSVTALSPMESRKTDGLALSGGAWAEISMTPLKNDKM